VDPTLTLLAQMDLMECSPPEFSMLLMAYWLVVTDRMYLDW
jgi:hypothetical protein